MSSTRRRTSRREICPHCSDWVSKKTLRAHKRVYYDSDSDQWIRKRRKSSNSDFSADDELDLDELYRPQSPESTPCAPPIVDFDDAEQNLTDPFEEEAQDENNTVSDSDSTEGAPEDEVWEEEGVEEDLAAETTAIESLNNTDSTSHSLVLWLVHFLNLLQKKHYIPDAALVFLISFLSLFFKVLGQLAPQLSGISQHFPASMYQMQKLLGTPNESFVRYVTCGKCYMVYNISDCTELVGSTVVPKLCTHKNSTRGRRCNGPLLKRVELITNKTIYYPMKVYCYTPLYKYMQSLLNRPGFHQMCDHWKEEHREEGIYQDVYDGKIWRDFQTYNGRSLLADPFTYGFMLNIDWFKPCKHVEYSIGAIYLTIMNLPRNVRFKQENVLLVGLLPGPREPKHDVNAFLEPLVEELLAFWNDPGVEMSVHSISEKVFVRCALLCVACDIPASRKVCGFLGHAAVLGCSKCLKKFPGEIGHRDYSGFDRSEWSARTIQEHRHNVSTIQACTTLTDRKQCESKYGCRFSILLNLPYFDPVRMTIIDPMHNLYLGSAKRLIALWIEKNLITNSNMSLIQDRVDSTPRYVGRIPHKIASSFSGFTADQFKNWTNLFSLIALRDILPSQHLQYWRYFVIASRILCQMSISDSEIERADAFLLQFCRHVERLLGKNVITPNMHLHCHLKQSLHDYGPIHNFWLFSYERYNGILEHFPFSNRYLEIQLMKRFYREFQLISSMNSDMPQQFELDFGETFRMLLHPTLKGSLQATIHGKYFEPVDPQQVCDWSLASASESTLPKSYVRSIFSSSFLSQLKNAYSLLYPAMDQRIIDYNTAFRKYRAINYQGITYNSGSIVFAKLPLQSIHSQDLQPRPVLIDYFALHAFENDQHLFAVVSWLKEHPDKDHFSKPLEMWWKDIVDTNFNIFVPVQLLICHAIYHMRNKLCICCVQ